MISVRVFGTPVKAKVTVLVNVVAVWGGVTWLGLYWHPKRRFWQGSLIGIGSVFLLLVAEFGHAMAHIFSARYAGEPMEEIRISSGMPRTLYSDNDVLPDVHRMRAMGGPVFNALGLLLSVATFGVVSRDSIVRELAAWSAAGHGLLLIASLLPLPIVDGGTILKWTLVARGRAETEADETVRRVNWVMGTVGGIIGVGLIAVRMWIAGVILVGIAVVVIGVAAGKIR